MRGMIRKKIPMIGTSLGILVLSFAGFAQAATPAGDQSQNVTMQQQNTDAQQDMQRNQNQENTSDNASMQNDPALDKSVMAALAYCQENYPACATATKNAAGVLVFPSVLKADFIVGGAGGKGALVENGKITGYYDIGAASAGLQLGFQDASQVYAFPTEQSLQPLKSGKSHWRVGGDLGVTVMAADANVRDVTGKTIAFIFDSKGLHGGISVDLFDIWKTGTTRPEPVKD